MKAETSFVSRVGRQVKKGEVEKWWLGLCASLGQSFEQVSAYIGDVVNRDIIYATKPGTQYPMLIEEQKEIGYEPRIEQAMQQFLQSIVQDEVLPKGKVLYNPTRVQLAKLYAWSAVEKQQQEGTSLERWFKRNVEKIHFLSLESWCDKIDKRAVQNLGNMTLSDPNLVSIGKKIRDCDAGKSLNINRSLEFAFNAILAWHEGEKSKVAPCLKDVINEATLTILKEALAECTNTYKTIMGETHNDESALQLLQKVKQYAEEQSKERQPFYAKVGAVDLFIASLEQKIAIRHFNPFLVADSAIQKELELVFSGDAGVNGLFKKQQAILQYPGREVPMEIWVPDDKAPDSKSLNGALSQAVNAAFVKVSSERSRQGAMFLE